jgi:mutator protein MutT
MDARGRVLIAQRPPGKHLAGMWEFPGGKVESGETRIDALRRELQEEIGIAIESPRPLLRVRHRYPHGDVLLDVWVVRRFHGEPRGLDGQALSWCNRASLHTAGLLPADLPIIGALRLPERLRIRETAYYRVLDFVEFMAGRSRSDGSRRLRGVTCRAADEAHAAVSGGANFVALDEPMGAGELVDLCTGLPAPVFVRGLSSGRAWGLGASGVNALG